MSDEVRKQPTTSANRNASISLLHDSGSADRVFKTTCVLYYGLAVGLITPLPGNTIVHMEYLFDVSTTSISYSLVARPVSALVGAIICGLVLDRVNHELAFVVATFIQGLSSALAPYIGGLVPYIIAIFVQSITWGFAIASSQTYIVGLWKGHRYRDPVVHSWHAVWALGGIAGTYIIAPFLVDLPLQPRNASTTESWQTYSIDSASSALTDKLTMVSSWNITSVTTSVLPLHVKVQGVNRASYSFVTIGLLTLITTVLFIVAYLRDHFKNRRDLAESASISQSSQELTNSISLESKATEESPSDLKNLCDDTPICDGNSRRADRYLYWLFVVQVVIFHHFYRDGEAVPMLFTTQFVVGYVKFSVDNASLLLSLFYAFQFFGRVIGVPAAAFLRPETMLVVTVLSTAVFYVLLLVFVNVWPTIVWVTIPMASFSLSTTFAAAMLWVSDHFPITGRMSSIILCANFSGAIVALLMVGQLYEASTPMWYVYSLAGSSIIVTVSMFVLKVYDIRYGNQIIRYALTAEPINGDARKDGGYKSISRRDS